MYTLTIQNFPNNAIEHYEYGNIREALEIFEAKCTAIGYDWTSDNEGNFIAGGLGHDWRIELNSNF